MSEARDLYTGLARGGPLNGREFTVRKPEGIVAIDKEANEATVYDYVDGEFVARDTVPLNDKKRWQISDEWRYEVIPVG